MKWRNNERTEVSWYERNEFEMKSNSYYLHRQTHLAESTHQNPRNSDRQPFTETRVVVLIHHVTMLQPNPTNTLQ